MNSLYALFNLIFQLISILRLCILPSLSGAHPNHAEALAGAGCSFVCDLFLHAVALRRLADPSLAGGHGSKPVARASAKPSAAHRGRRHRPPPRCDARPAAGAWLGGYFAALVICIGQRHTGHAVLWHQGVTGPHTGKGCPFCDLR